MQPPFFLDVEYSIPLPTPAGYQDSIQLDRAAAYIRDHFADDLTLDELARVAGISKYHFHRLFSDRYGETVGDYIKRTRLEKAALKLISESSSSVTKIAFDCGFSSSQYFAKSFKAHFGVSPVQVHSKFNWENILMKKIQNMEIDYGKRHCLPAEVKQDGTFIKIPTVACGCEGKSEFQELEVLNMPSYRVAYTRTRGRRIAKVMGHAMDSLAKWAAPKGLFMGNSMMISAAGMVPDLNGEYTYDTSVTVPENVAIVEDEDVKIQYLPGGLYAVYHGKFQTPSDHAAAWDRLTCGWWASSYFPRKPRPCCEIYYNDPAIHPNRTSLVDICLPITTLSK